MKIIWRFTKLKNFINCLRLDCETFDWTIEFFCHISHNKIKIMSQDPPPFLTRLQKGTPAGPPPPPSTKLFKLPCLFLANLLFFLGGGGRWGSKRSHEWGNWGPKKSKFLVFSKFESKKKTEICAVINFRPIFRRHIWIRSRTLGRR